MRRTAENLPAVSYGDAPKHVVTRFQELRSKAEHGLTLDEEKEYLVLRRVLTAYEQVSPLHARRVQVERDRQETLREWEARAQELRERAEYLQGLRKDLPTPRIQVFVRNIVRSK